MKEDKSNCIFCKILAGKSPVSMVYEDKYVAVFPPLQPVNLGHLLIIPKKHAPYLKDLDDKTAMHIMRITKRMGAAIRKSKLKCEGLNLFVADGEVALQEIFHFHMHVFPRYKGDGFGLKHGKKNFIKMPRPKLDQIAAKIKKELTK